MGASWIRLGEKEKRYERMGISNRAWGPPTIKTGTKVWCGCSADYDNAEANTHTCPICLGHPGALPKLNKK